MRNEIWGIVLAAGISRRMGTPKMLLPYREKTLIRSVIEKSLNSVLDGVVVVINPKVEGLYKEVSLTRVKQVIINNDSHIGMSSSIKAGLHSLPKQVEAAVILLGDQPEINEKSINKVVEAFLKHKPAVVQSVFLNNKKGHPVLFKRNMFPHLLETDGDSGGKFVIQKFNKEVVYAEMNQMNIPDIDTFEDYQRLIKEEGVRK
ncbi:nucleotidyltransferase family protein [Neobacillus sp. B4I6]|uniref:nucleotidyltransferase family protein n=1 Tax=Neobacillus sp. B4I6 TaxID=3373925 RepID=UPI003D25EFF2